MNVTAAHQLSALLSGPSRPVGTPRLYCNSIFGDPLRSLFGEAQRRSGNYWSPQSLQRVPFDR